MTDLDLGTDEHVLDLGLAGRHPFRHSAAMGLGVGVADRLTPGRDRRMVAVTAATARAFRKAVPFRVRLEFPDGDHERLNVDDVLDVAVRRIAGVVEVHLVQSSPLRDHLAIGRRLRRGQTVDHPRVHQVASPVVRVVTTPKTDVVLDGEIGTYTPITFRARREVSSRPR